MTLYGIVLLIAFAMGFGLFAWRSNKEAIASPHLLLQLEAGSVVAVVETTDVGQKKEVTVLFADLIGFTALSEMTPPAVLVRILNGYFERMSQAITGHRGYVSTFIGDGILALFGAMVPNPWQGNDAAHAALAMHTALAEYNAELAAEGLPTLAVGVGLHRGTGVAGLVGSRQRKEFTVVGRIVNVAARVQDLTRKHPASTIVTKALADSLDPRFRLRPLPDTPVKGIQQPLAIFALDGLEGREVARSSTA